LTKKGTLSELAWPPDGKVILCYVDTEFSIDKKTIIVSIDKFSYVAMLIPIL
jgi:hypothetical protein